MPLRIAAIEFLNAAPLMWGLESDTRFALFHTLPSACADALRGGSADLGVIPAIELARIPGLVGLASRGVAAVDAPEAEVRSILLVSRCPPGEIRTLALDRASRTSAALVQILLRRRFGARFVTRPGSADWRRGLAEADAALLIGDPALKLRVSGAAGAFQVFDLAREWRAWTGLPFVFALWGIRGAAFEANREWLPARLRLALDQGIEQREALVAAWAPRLELPPAEVRRYLSGNVAYHLSPAHRRGLRRFFDLAAEEGLLGAVELPRLEDEGEAGAA